MAINNVIREKSTDGRDSWVIVDDPEEFVDECDHPSDSIQFVEFEDGKNGYLCTQCGADTHTHLSNSLVVNRLQEQMADEEEFVEFE